MRQHLGKLVVGALSVVLLAIIGLTVWNAAGGVTTDSVWYGEWRWAKVAYGLFVVASLATAAIFIALTSGRNQTPTED